MMKRVITLMGLVLMQHLSGYCQKALIMNDDGNVLYINRQNVIHVMVEGRECRTIEVITDNGSVEKALTPCGFVVMPDRMGTANLTLLKRGSRKRIGKISCRVTEVPRPITVVANKAEGEIQISTLVSQEGVIIKDDKFRSRAVVTGFFVSVWRKDSLLYAKHIVGPYFNNEIKKEFSVLQPGDKVFFSDVGYANSNLQKETSTPVELTIIE